MFSVRTWLQGAVAGSGLAVAALAMPGAAQAVPVNGTQSLGAITTASSLPNLALGDTLTNIGTFFGGSQSGDFTAIVAGTAVNDTALTATLGQSYSFTSVDGDFAGMISVNPSLIIKGDQRTLSVFVLGTFTPAGVLSGFDSGPASMVISYTESAGRIGTSFSFSGTLASPPIRPPPPVPEPMTLALLGVGLVGLGVVRYRKAG